MSVDYKKLAALQDIDIKILKEEHSKKEFPESVENLKSEISDTEENLEYLKDLLEKKRGEKTNTEQEIADARESLDKSQERLSSIKTNKEYDAVHSEIEVQKRIVATGGDRIEELAEDIEGLQGEIKRTEEQLDKIKESNQPKIDELEDKISHIDSNIDKLIESRDEIKKDIPVAELKKYEMILETRKTNRVVSVINSSERICSICRQVVPPRQINELFRGKRIVKCNGCGSILVPEEETGNFDI